MKQPQYAADAGRGKVVRSRSTTAIRRRRRPEGAASKALHAVRDRAAHADLVGVPIEDPADEGDDARRCDAFAKMPDAQSQELILSAPNQIAKAWIWQAQRDRTKIKSVKTRARSPRRWKWSPRRKCARRRTGARGAPVCRAQIGSIAATVRNVNPEYPPPFLIKREPQQRSA